MRLKKVTHTHLRSTSSLARWHRPNWKIVRNSSSKIQSGRSLYRGSDVTWEIWVTWLRRCSRWSLSRKLSPKTPTYPNSIKICPCVQVYRDWRIISTTRAHDSATRHLAWSSIGQLSWSAHSISSSPVSALINHRNVWEWLFQVRKSWSSCASVSEIRCL